MSRRRTTAEGVLLELRRDILTGHYTPGQRLVTSVIAARFATSLSPVREALSRLMGEGLVDVRPRHGARVRGLSSSTLRDGLQVVGAGGTLALQLLAPKLREPRIRRRIAQDAMDIAEPNGRYDAAAAFAALAAAHRVLMIRSGNACLTMAMDRMCLEYLYRKLAEFVPEGRWHQYIEDYQNIARSLMRSDLAEAQVGWNQHIVALMSLLQAGGPPR